MKRTWFLLGTLVVLAGCGSPEQNAIWTAEKAVANMLKDPESAKFNGSFFMPDGGNEQLKSGHVCGYVNAKILLVHMLETEGLWLRRSLGLML